MNARLQEQFDRVESALNTLVDSITSYNPSPAAASSLVEADDQLSSGLEKRKYHFAAHQASYDSLLTLQATSDALDQRIKATLTLLANTRKELLVSTPITNPPEGARTVEYGELLGLAQSIAKFTVPPTYRPPLPPSIDDPVIKQEVASPQADVGSTPTVANGLAVTSQTPTGQSTPSHLDPNSNKEGLGKAVNTLTPQQKEWLERTSDPTNAQFTPWPNDNVIRRGALAQIQTLRERGQDPALANIPGDAEAAEREADNTAKREQVDIGTHVIQQDGPRPKETSAPQRLGVTKREDAPLDEFDLYDPDAD